MSTHRVTLELPAAPYRNLRRMVDSGEYATESDAVADVLLDVGLDVGLDPAPGPGDPAFEHWLRTEVVAAYDELEAHPERGLSSEQLDAELAAARMEFRCAQ